MAPEDDADVTEHNYFLDTLRDSKVTTQACADAVHAGQGSPLAAIAEPIATGGWVCTEADTWTSELNERCHGILDSFTEAVHAIDAAIGREPQRVEQHHPHGVQWPRTWSHQNHLRL